MKKSTLVVGLVSVALLIGAGWWRFSPSTSQSKSASSAKPATATATTASSDPTSANGNSTTLEIKPSEVFPLSEQNIRQTVAITGTIKAVQSAFVKVKVAGEIQDLNLREGDAVKAGQVIGKIDNTESLARLKQAQQQAASAQSQLEIAQRQFDNNQALMTQGFISKSAFDNASSSMMGAKATYQAALEGVNLAQKALNDTVLKSPMTGIISQKLAQTGERLSVDSRVYEVVNLSRLELETSLPISEAQFIKLGQTARLSLDSTELQNIEAKVVRINPSVQTGSRSVLIYLSVAPHPALKHGLFANGQIFIGERNALVVPLQAVRTDKPNPYVQILEGNLVKNQVVQTKERGEINGTTVIEITGIASNSKILAPSLGIVREGTVVRVLESQPITGQ